MKIRCDLHVNDGARKLVLVAGPQETDEHLALKLAGFLLFWDLSPIVDASAKHPALLDQEFRPDLMALDETGEAKLWVECGKVTQHKLSKVARRFGRARLVVLKETEADARRFRADSDREFDGPAPVEIWAWPQRQFRDWMSALGEKTEVFGEARGRMLNIVVNERPLVAELVSY